MAPKAPESEGLDQKEAQEYTGKLANEIGTDPNYKPKWYLNSISFYFFLHLFGTYGLYLFLVETKWPTFFWTYALCILSGESITMGAHRLYAHRSFKASLSLRIFLNTFQLLSGQNSMYTWARDHRLHHKFSDTDADPHNAERGFFFSHAGWLMAKKHPAVKEKYKTLDLSDLQADKVVMFQYKHFFPLYLIFSILIPVLVPMYFFDESVKVSILVCYMFRYAITLNITWTVNSLAHLYGYKPYDKFMKPCENWFVALIALGEGWHNYHHAFPWDYKASEYGIKLNLTKYLIDILSYLGFAYDLRTAPECMVVNRINRTGDGTHRISKQEL